MGLRVIDRAGWAGLVQNDVLFGWGMFIVGPLVGLEAALLADVDHRGGHWTRLFALPVLRLRVATETFESVQRIVLGPDF